jgi:F-type H+-transporting ATPase subunit b
MAVLISELVGFVVILFVLYRFILPLIKKMVADRQEVIQKQVDDAEEATRNLEAAQARLDSAVEQAKVEGARIRDDARADSTRIHEELVAQAEQEVERIKQRGQEQLAAQRDQVVRGLRSQVGGSSMQLAEKLVVDSLADDTARSASVDGFLSEIDSLDRNNIRLATPAGGGAS